MKKEKGFTLIELLAVIVILAILMVIAVPKILNVINNSKKSAAESSIKLLKDAIKTQVTSKDMMNSNFISDENGCYVFEFSPNNDNANTLNVKNKDKFTGSIKYCKGTFSDDTLKFNDVASNGGSTKSVLCKRATTLHTEECKITGGRYYCSGAGYTTSGSKGTSTITYGNLGTKGTLASGDAFDCDVNGDGTYDSNTERFYYVSDYYNTSTKAFEDDTAVLVYYNNVSAGSPNALATYVYDSSDHNYYGPRTATAQLPTTSGWSSVSLKNTTRAILNEKDGNTTAYKSTHPLPTEYSYAGYAARFLTVNEVKNGCKLSSINEKEQLDNKCEFLLENTAFSDSNLDMSYWLENPLSSDTGISWTIESQQRYIGQRGVNPGAGFGVRPVIEVSKTNIEY